jgi:beta-N-acetylhexosaminidase
LSSRVVQGQIRSRLGFRGVTITDAIEAGALRRYGGIGRRGVLAARAGMDLLLFSNKDVGEGDQGLSALTAALRSHSLNLTTFRAAVGRILALRRDLASGRPLPSP